MNGRGRLHVVGVGPSSEDAMSIGALRALEEASELWLMDLGPPGHERTFLRKWLHGGRKVVNLHHYYLLRECPRDLIYRLAAQRILHLVGCGRNITLLLSGNPEIWAYATGFFKQCAERGELDLRITPSMSFIDVIYSHTPFSCTDGLQVRLGALDSPDVSPDIDCIVGQVGDDGTTRAMSSALLTSFYETVERIYSPDHLVFLVGHHSVDGEPVCHGTTVASLPGVIAAYEGYHFSLFLPSRSQVQALMDSLEPGPLDAFP